MDIKKFAKFLITVAVMLVLLGGFLFVQWKEFPKGQTNEAQQLRRVVVGMVDQVDNNYVSPREARTRLDKMYAADEQRPQYVDYLLIAAAAIGLLGIGMLVSAKSK